MARVDQEIGTTFHEDEIAALAMDVLKHLKDSEAEIDIKVAALRSAAEILQQAIHRRLMAISMFNAVNPTRR